MGQQQLLLIILGVIIVGIAVAVGITMFQDSAVSANRDAVTNDLVNLGARAQQYYRRPTSLGGGSNKFDGITLADLTSKAVNANGTYTLGAIVLGAGGSVTVNGVGVEIGDNGTAGVELNAVIFSDSIGISRVN